MTKREKAITDNKSGNIFKCLQYHAIEFAEWLRLNEYYMDEDTGWWENAFSGGNLVSIEELYIIFDNSNG